MQTQDFRALGIGPKTLITGAVALPTRSDLGPAKRSKQFFIILALEDCVFSGIQLYQDTVPANTYNPTFSAGVTVVGIKPGVGSLVSGTCIVYMGK